MCAHMVWAVLHSMYEKGHDLVASLADVVLAAALDCCWDADLCQLLDAPLDVQIWSSASSEMNVDDVTRPVLVRNLINIFTLPGTTSAP